MERPPLKQGILVQDFTDFYWLKEELVAFCRQQGLPTAGGKMELAERIRAFLTTGQAPVAPKPLRLVAAFDWAARPLNGATVITGTYKNTENVRLFFTQAIGHRFAFTVAFMQWMRENVGQTLQDAVGQWHLLHALTKDPTHATAIAPQFEYNRYMRAFLADNPSLTIQAARQCWLRKRAQRGGNEYEKEDLALA